MKRIRPAQMAACLAAVLVMTGCAQAGELNTETQSTSTSDVESVIQSQGVHEASSQELADGTVTVTGGTLQGTQENGIYRFLGVPYAEAAERFTPASDVTPWEGVRVVDSYGAIPPQQGILGMGGSDAGAGTDNNCQNLNIWTPGLDDGGKRPIMVWLHGGGFSTGSANESEYDGEDLAREGDVVVVGVNARLNVFGFFDLASYGDQYQYSANVGILDIQKALEWIQDNAAAFGGDPDNVTIFGQSGGGAKVLALMTSPYAKGLFQKGIVESGATEGMGVHFTTKEVSREITERTLQILGITEDSIEKIQTVDADDLLDASSEALSDVAEEEQIPGSFGSGYELAFEPVVDGDYLPTDPVTEDGFAEAGRDVPLLIGSNLVEWAGYVPSLQYTNVTDEEQKAFDSAYPMADPDEIREVDTLLRLPILKITAHKADQNGAQVYSYVFTEGTYHGAEIPYVFGHRDDATGQVLSQAWISFARDGVPSADGMPAWEPYTRAGGAAMLLGSSPVLAHHHDEELLHLLEPDYTW